MYWAGKQGRRVSVRWDKGESFAWCLPHATVANFVNLSLNLKLTSFVLAGATIPFDSIRFDSFQSSVRFGCVLFWCLTSWQASNNISFLRICRAGFSFDCDPIDLAIGISNRKIKLNRTERNRFFAHLAGRRFPLNWKRLWFWVWDKRGFALGDSELQMVWRMGVGIVGIRIQESGIEFKLTTSVWIPVQTIWMRLCWICRAWCWGDGTGKDL